jgi:hypothetical protein
MKRFTAFKVLLLLAILAALAGPIAADPPTGTLVLDVLPYESEVKLKKNIRAQFDRGGIEWGILENELVISLVSRQYVGADLPQLTRYGQQDSLELPAGEYRITCIGLTLESMSRSVDELLSKSAYFNKDILNFSILPGQTTRLAVHSLIRKQKAGFLLKAFSPQLKIAVDDGREDERETVISDRIASSIPWDRYSGPLKSQSAIGR